jgi:transcriptional regulator with XRE-family HTH domain
MNNEGKVIHMELDVAALAQRVREAREAAGVSQDEARKAIGVSQPTYSRIETGERPLKGDELVLLADRFGVRVSAISGLAQVAGRARFAARTDGSSASMATMRDRLYAYLELDNYLTGQGITGA